jgi:hypothetical protein
VLLALWVTARAWGDPASRIVQTGVGDPDLAAWWLRYSAEAIAHWRLPALITTGMNTPTGVSAMWNTSLLAPGVALSPVTLLFGPHVTINVITTGSFAGSATALYWVLRRWGCGTLAAVAAGLVYGFSPALTGSALGHYHMMFAVLPPLIIHFTVRLLTGKGSPVAAGAALGLLAALQVLTGEEVLFYTIMAMAVGLLVAGVTKVRSLRAAASADALLSLLSGVMTAAGVFVMVAGYPLWVQFAGPLTQHGSPWLADYYKNDLAGLVEPSSLQLIHSAGSVAFANNFQGGLAEYLGYLGWPMLAVVAWAAVALWRLVAVRALAVTFLVLEVFSLGGTLLFHGHHYAWFTLPWGWLQNYPLFGSAVVDRFSIIADGCAAALLAIVIDAGWRAVGGLGLTASRLVAARVAIGLAAAVAVVPMFPAQMQQITLSGVPSGWTQAIGDLHLPAGAGVLVLPVPSDTFTDPLRWQADSGVPASIVGGYFLGPLAGGEAGAPGPGQEAQYLNGLWQQSVPAGIDSGGAAASNQPVSQQDVATWISGTGVSAVIAVTTRGSPLETYLSGILGNPATQSGDVIGWRVPGA